MRLIHWQDRERRGISISKIESPFFARSKVQEAFYGGAFSRIEGLDVCSYSRARSQEEILEAVEKGGAVVGVEQPLQPVKQ